MRTSGQLTSIIAQQNNKIIKKFTHHRFTNHAETRKRKNGEKRWQKRRPHQWNWATIFIIKHEQEQQNKNTQEKKKAHTHTFLRSGSAQMKQNGWRQFQQVMRLLFVVFAFGWLQRKHLVIGIFCDKEK